MELEILKVLAQQGIVGILAYGMFKVYEKTTKDHAAKIAEMAEAYQQNQQEHIENWKGQSAILVGVVEKNTEAMTALKASLENRVS